MDGLSAMGVEVGLLCLDHPGEPSASWTSRSIPVRPTGFAKAIGWRLSLAAARRADQFALYRSPRLQLELQQTIDDLRPDVVDFQHSFMWVPTKSASVLSLIDVHSHRLARGGTFSRVQIERARSMERTAILSAPRTVTLSELDRTRALELVPERSDILTVPLGVSVGAVKRRMSQPPKVQCIGYVGAFDYEPNVEAAKILLDQWPGISRDLGIRKLVLAGRAAAQHFRPAPGVEIRSDVPDMYEVMHELDILVVPLVSGGGVRVKIIEAFALGVPVVSTKLGIEGLNADDGKHAIIVPSAEEVPAGLARAADSMVRNRLSVAAHAHWEAGFSAGSMAARMLDIYREVV